MHKWKKILADGKLIKEVSIEGCKLSITLHDQYNNKDNYYSINNMFANMWYLTPSFQRVFERSTLHDQAPYLNLKKINTYLTAQAALTALIDFGTNNQKTTKVAVLPPAAELDEAPYEEEEVEQPDNIVKPKKKRRVVHAWKKLLSNGELIQSLEIKNGVAYIKLFDAFNQRHFFKGMNITLQKLYDSSVEFQQMYRRPTMHTNCPYLILLKQDPQSDSAAMLNNLVNMAKSPPKQTVEKESVNNSEKGSVAGIVSVAAEEPATPVVKVTDLYDIFNDLLTDPIIDFEQPEYPLGDLENYSPFLGFNFTMDRKIESIDQANVNQANVHDDRRVPILHLKLNRQ